VPLTEPNLRPRLVAQAGDGLGRYAALACPAPRRISVKKLLLLLIVVALGAAIAKKVRTA
jgi:hypothetical protein